jgi:hypothetical protein
VGPRKYPDVGSLRTILLYDKDEHIEAESLLREALNIKRIGDLRVSFEMDRVLKRIGVLAIVPHGNAS